MNIAHFFSTLANLLYMTSGVKKKILARYPNENIIAINACKAIKTAQALQIERGRQWVSSRRAVVCLTNKKIICKDWEIPLESIKYAQMLLLKSRLSQGQVLKIETHEGMHYQFGMQYQPAWLEQDVLKIERVSGKLKMSTFSWLVRMLLMIYIVYVVVKNFVLS